MHDTGNRRFFVETGDQYGNALHVSICNAAALFCQGFSVLINMSKKASLRERPAIVYFHKRLPYFIEDVYNIQTAAHITWFCAALAAFGFLALT
jgi:hypothetical protein